MAQFWGDRPVLITGCTGLLGSWLTLALIERGAKVTGLVRDLVPESELVRSGAINRINVVHGDVRDQRNLERTLAEYEIDTVFHLAAQTIVGTANQGPVGTFESNIQGTWSLLEACRRSSSVRQIVAASSDKAYGSHDRLPYDENAPLQGRHPYDVSKSCADLLVRSYADTYRLPACITRCGNLFGGGDLNWSRLIPGTIRSVAGGERPVIRSDGTYVRDYLYVEDAVMGYLILAENLAERRELMGEAFNFSNEIHVTVLDMVGNVLRLMGKAEVEPEVLSETRNEIRHQYLDATKAKDVLSWNPRFTLDEGLQRTINWYSEFLSPAPSR